MIRNWKRIVLSTSIEILRLSGNYVKCYFHDFTYTKGTVQYLSEGVWERKWEDFINFLAVLKGSGGGGGYALLAELLRRVLA